MTATRSVDDEAAPSVAMEELGDIGIVGFDRADGFNSFDKATRIAFRDSLLKLEKNDAIRAVVIHGNDRGFNVGADLNEFLREKISGAEIKRQLHEEYSSYARIDSHRRICYEYIRTNCSLKTKCPYQE